MKMEASVQDLQKISRKLEEKETMNSALWLDEGAFSIAYRFLLRYIRSYHTVAYRALVTLIPKDSSISEEEFEKITEEFGIVINSSLRKSDLMMQEDTKQFFLLLPELSEEYVETVFARIRNQWKNTDYYETTNIRFDAEVVSESESYGDDQRHYRVNIVPYDYFNKNVKE